MDLKFDSLSITDFKSFRGGPHVLNFTDYEYGLCMLRGENQVQEKLGSNGAGKSSVWDALCWCLTGRTPQGLRNPDIKPWKGSKKTRVVLSVTVDDVSHTIVRTANPNAILIDDKSTSQEFVDRLVGMSFDVLTNTVILAQGEDLFFDLKSSEKMELFTDALNLSKWDQRSAAASDAVKALETQKLAEQSDRISLQSRLEESQKLHDRLREKSRTYEDDKFEAKEKLEKDRVALDKKRESIVLKKSGAEIIADEHGVRAEELKKEFQSAYDVLFELRDKQSAVHAARKLLLREMKTLSEEISDLEDSEFCPTCQQPLAGTDLAKHIRSVKKKIEQKRKAIRELKIKKADKAYAKQENRIEQIRPDLDRSESIVKEHESVIRMHELNLSDVDVEIRTNQRELKRLADEDNPYLEDMSKLKKACSVYSTALEECDEILKKLDRRIARTKYWVKGFKDVRLHILTEVLMELEIATNAMLESVGLVDWRVEFEIEVDTKSGTTKRGLHVLIQSPQYSEAVRWESWSGGEKQRLRLIGAFALSEVLLSHAGVFPDLEVVDEPERGLSREGVSDLCHFLSERGKELRRQIWYTDHRSVESSQFSAIVGIVHDKKGSRIDG